jgi:hypothetical protein
MRDGVFEYVTNADGVTLTDFTPEQDPQGDLLLPASLGGKPVTEIAPGAFSAHSSEVTRLVVPEGVRRIDNNAFSWMLFLKELDLPESLLSLGRDFASGTSLRQLRIPQNVREIEEPGSAAFSMKFEPGNPVWSSDGYGIFKKKSGDVILAASDPNVSVRVYRIPDGVTEIAPDAFSGREDIEELEIPASVREIGEGAFSNVDHMYSDKSGIREVRFPGGNSWFHAESSYLAQKDRLIRWFGDEKHVQVPDGISVIASECFYRCPSEEIILPPSVKTIHRRAFVLCLARKVTIGADHLSILFPEGGTYLQEKLMEGFGKDGKRYSFAYYDKSLYTGLLDLVKAQMLLGRLAMQTNPAAELDSLTAQKLKSTLAEKLPDLFKSAAASGDLQAMRALAEWDGMRESDFETAIRAAQEYGRQEMIAFLVRRKLERTGHDVFDFSL